MLILPHFPRALSRGLTLVLLAAAVVQFAPVVVSAQEESSRESRREGRGFGGEGRGGDRGGFGGRSRGGFSMGDPNSLSTQLRDDEFKASMKFSEEQTAAIEKLRDEFREQFRQSFREQKSREEIDAMLKQNDEKLLQILNDDQKKQWEVKKAALVAAAAQNGGQNGAPSATPATPGTTGPAVPSGAMTGTPGPRPVFPTTPSGPPPGEKAVVSFDGAAAPAGVRDGRMTFNFRYAPWADVLKLFAERAGLTLDLADTPPGTFSYFDNRSYTPTEALDVLNGYLLPKGYVLVRRDQFLVVANIADGIAPYLIPEVTPEDLAGRGRNELVSVVMPLTGIDAEKAAVEVKELLGPLGKVAPLKNTNSIVVTDVGSNVQRVYRLLSESAGLENKDLAFKSIPLKFVSATEAERTVRRLFGLQPPVTSPTPTFSFQGGGDRGRDWGRDRERGGDPRQMQQQPAPAANNPNSKIQVTAEPRTNSLLVAAPTNLLKTVEEVVASLDVDKDGTGRALGQGAETSLRVYSVAAGDTAQITRTLNQLMPGVVIGEDVRAGKIHIQATESEHVQVEGLIKQLGGDAGSSVAVINLSKLDPVAATNTIRSLFEGGTREAPNIEPDSYGNRLMIRGTPEQIAQVKTLLAELGEDGTGQAKSKTGTGNVRTLSLGGRDPEELIPLLQKVWSAAEPHPIRIVVPSQQNPIRERKVPGQEAPLQPAFDDARPNDRPGRSAARDAILVKPISQEAAVAPADAAERATTEGADPIPEAPPVPEAAPATNAPAEATTEATTRGTTPAVPRTPKAADPTVAIAVNGDEIVLSSSDQQALDRMEEMIDALSNTIEPRVRWTVFYLRSADATETAQMLERLFPTSSVSATSDSGGMFGGFSSSFSSLGRSVVGATGLTSLGSGPQPLRIITDIRANALFVSGPGDKVSEIEQMLQVLDATELPGTLRDRMPRTIAVEFADAQEVADLVEDLFKDKMQAEPAMGGQGGRNFNPLAMLMGAQGGQNGRQQRGPELSIGVDERTNNLLVSANDTLFRQVEEVVKDADQRAKDARQTVRVVTLEKADPALVQQSLSSLIPKVTVSGSRSSTVRRSRSGESGRDSGSNNNQNQGGDQGEMIRRMMEQRMQQQRSGGGQTRSFGGGTGTRSFGGGSGFGGGNRQRGSGGGQGGQRRGGR